MFKKIAFGSCGVLALLMGAQIAPSFAQSAPSPDGQQVAQPAQSARASVPDDVRLGLMIRNAVIALNQANVTGNYSVLRDMGTPNFQMTNSSARLAEAFSSLRARKLDLSPILIFNPKLQGPPTMAEGQVLRLAGFFPTQPERVNFDLAFQLYGDQWMLAGIAVNTAPAAESAQAGGGQPADPMRSADNGPASSKPGEAKPIRIDLSQPPPPARSPTTAPKKPAAAKKPKAPVQQTAAAQPQTTTPSPVPATPAEDPVQKSTPGEAPQEQPAPPPSSGWNPFGR